nr:hypothetical protein [Tanacetum cinerariifolium]
MDSEVVKDRAEGSETRVEGSSKRIGEELESNKSKKQKLNEKVEAEVDNDQEEAKMRMYMKIVSDDEVAIDAIPLATKPPIIVDWKIIKEGKITSYHIIRVDGSSKRINEVFRYILLVKIKLLIKKLEDSKGERQVWGRNVGIKRLLSVVEVTAGSYEVTTTGYGFYC